MDKRELGRSGLHIAPLVFGGNVFGWTADTAMSFRLLDAFVAAGFNTIDTADMYSIWVPGHHGGESEAVIGQWLKARGNRDKVVIATKVGMDMQAGGKGLSTAHIIKSVEGSLKRLQTDYIDLYQSHEDDLSLPVEEPLSAYARLIEQGKVRVIGASNFSASRLSEALAASTAQGLPRYESLQPYYNLCERADFEDGAQAVCVAQGLGVIPYFSLASGFLTGKYRSIADFGKSPRGEDMDKYLNPRGLNILAALDQVAARHTATPAQVALAWLLTRPAITAPIASATKPEQFEDIAKAAFLNLDQADLDALNSASAL